MLLNNNIPHRRRTVSQTSKSKNRIYICHTYYHVYMSVIKELALQKTISDKADIILSTMSNDFETLDMRLRESGLFDQVFTYDEQEDVTSDTIMEHHRNRGNLLSNMYHRIIYTKMLGALQEPYIPTDLKAYKDVYVFCDSDPVGYYLNYKKIPYHAIEDGLNSGKLDDQARLSNAGAFKLKCLLAKTGLIFIECGYSRYCIDYEVNDISANHSVPPNVIEVSHESITAGLDAADHEILARIFISDWDEIRSVLVREPGSKPTAMILTEPLCEYDVRKKLFADIIDMYKDDYEVIIKPHPRDELKYDELFDGVTVIRSRFPMEVLNDITEIRINLLISVITQVEDIRFADRIVYLGLDFMDKYESPEVHRKLDSLV